MAKLPYAKFYFGDWILATRGLTDEEKAIWIDTLAFMWLRHEDQGTLSGTWDEISRVLGRERLNVQVVIDSLKKKNILEMVEDHNLFVTIKSRRMIRDVKELKLNAKRQFRHRSYSNASSNAFSNGKVTLKKSEVRSQKSDKDNYSIDSPKTGESVETAAPPTETTNPDRPLTDIQRLVKGWKVLNNLPISGEESKDWDRAHFKRHARASKTLLELFKSPDTCLDLMQYVFDRLRSKSLECTIETVVKRSDWYREVLAGVRK